VAQRLVAGVMAPFVIDMFEEIEVSHGKTHGLPFTLAPRHFQAKCLSQGEPVGQPGEGV
jgi:hypothetical protein